jgi:hypothetical protein
MTAAYLACPTAGPHPWHTDTSKGILATTARGGSPQGSITPEVGTHCRTSAW